MKGQELPLLGSSLIDFLKESVCGNWKTLQNKVIQTDVCAWGFALQTAECPCRQESVSL